MLLANDIQKQPLLVFIISKLTGNVRTQLQGKTYNEWIELKSILNNLYQDQKHYILLMEELNTIKQKLNESIFSFHERLDRLIMRIINTMPFTNIDEQKIKIQTIQELALSRFIYHSVPDILRFQNVTDISEALTKFVAEERALKIPYSESNKQSFYCTICNRNGHTTKSCYRIKSTATQKIVLLNRSSPQNSIPAHPPQQNNTHKFCRYCKKQGHLIHECRRREYNNNMRIKNQINVSATSANVHLNSSVPQVNAELAGMNIHKA